ncbi:gamma aminobutyric acid receptor subunit [Echinococcus multilocularis]|uniref:Gamma aminobutyric acid receptor subunit n=1 Tax=Echinococcus multilocularis TaxID=6211 RepID=A0A068YCC5_ECHMU|nr:gamma aminobutyric acid receptor subunit [Echinococcus multilocularis]
MSHFPQRSAKDESNLLRSKEAGSSLAVDILRGRSSSQTHYTIGCLKGPTGVELRKHLNPIALTPAHSQAVASEGSIGSETALNSFILKQDSPIRPRLPPLPMPPLQTGCGLLHGVYEDIFPSHSYQRRPSNMGWNGAGGDGWRFETSTLYENPINCLPTAGTSPIAEMKKLKGTPHGNGSMNSVADSLFKGNFEKALTLRVALPTKASISADEETYTSHRHLHHPLTNSSSLKPHRQRSPWRSFVKESTVPDVPVDPLDTSVKISGLRRSGRMKIVSPNHRRISLEKSVTWKDHKHRTHQQHHHQQIAGRGTERQTSSKGISLDLQASQMDELVSVLSDLCDTLGHSPILMPSLKRETSPETWTSGAVLAQIRRKSGEIGRELRHLAIRKEKVVVEVRVVFLKIGEIDTLKEFYQADAFLQAKWHEPRLDGKLPEELGTVDLERYWNPLCYIDNILSETKEVQWLSTSIGQNGEVYIVERRRIKGVFLETLELNDFPLDVQDLTITVTTERPDTEVDLIPDHLEMSAINKQTFVDQQEWKLHEHVEITKRVIRQEYSRSMKSHPCLSVTCRAARRPGYFYWNVFLIMFMISGLSFATFAVSPDKAELRLRLSFTLILTSVTFKYVITQSLPRISYLTYMDKYVLMSLAILCVISIWHAVIAILPVNAMSSVDDIAFLNSSAAAINVSSTNPDLLHQALAEAYPPTPSESRKSTFQSGPPSVPKTQRQRRAWTPLTNIGAGADSPTSSLKNGASLGDFTLNNEMVSLYFLALLRAYMDVQDRVELSRFPDAQQIEEQRRLEVMKLLEQNVFISFAVLYVVVHCIFIFILYFDASKRRREMCKKDKEYRSKVAVSGGKPPGGHPLYRSYS